MLGDSDVWILFVCVGLIIGLIIMIRYFVNKF